MHVRTIDPIRLNDLLIAGDRITLLDVRRKEDLEASAHQLTGARWCDPGQVDSWRDQVPRDCSVVIYCVRGGSVSNQVVDQLRAAGVDALFIEGGIEAWRQAGLPLQAR